MAGGRPSKLTPETQKRIVDAIRIGVTYKDAANAAGITYETFNEWRKAGEEAKTGKFSDFSDALTRAQAEGRVGLVANIRGAGKKDWRASAWLLERHDPETYHLATKTQLSGDPDNPTPIATESKVILYIPSNGREEPDNGDDDDSAVDAAP